MGVRCTDRRPLWWTPWLAATGLLLAGCGDDSGPGDTTSPTTADGSVSTTAAGGSPATDAFIDIQTCTAKDGTGTASGTITNTGATVVAYRIVMGFLDDAGTKVAEGSVETPKVEPGKEVPWSVTAAGVTVAEPTCKTQQVLGV